MGWTRGDGIINAATQNSVGMKVADRKKLLDSILEQVAELDYDQFDEHIGEDPILDEVLVEGGYVNRPVGKKTIKFWPYVDRWSLLEMLHDEGIVSNTHDDNVNWLRCREEYELTLEIDFDNETAIITHFMDQKLNEPRSILS